MKIERKKFSENSQETDFWKRKTPIERIFALQEISKMAYLFYEKAREQKR